MLGLCPWFGLCPNRLNTPISVPTTPAASLYQPTFSTPSQAANPAPPPDVRRGFAPPSASSINRWGYAPCSGSALTGLTLQCQYPPTPAASLYQPTFSTPSQAANPAPPPDVRRGFAPPSASSNNVGAMPLVRALP